MGEEDGSGAGSPGDPEGMLVRVGGGSPPPIPGGKRGATGEGFPGEVGGSPEQSPGGGSGLGGWILSPLTHLLCGPLEHEITRFTGKKTTGPCNLIPVRPPCDRPHPSYHSEPFLPR